MQSMAATNTTTNTTAIGATPSTAEVTHSDVLVLMLEIDDLCTLPHCVSDLVHNFVMAVQGIGAGV